MIRLTLTFTPDGVETVTNIGCSCGSDYGHLVQIGSSGKRYIECIGNTTILAGSEVNVLYNDTWGHKDGD